MIVGGNYSSPVLVNGISCRNCAEVDQAKKNIDLADPGGGPFGVNSAKSNSPAGAKSQVFDARLSDPVELAKAHRQANEGRGSDIARAYGGASQTSGTLLQVTI